MLERHRLLWVGISLSALFWLLETAVHTWVFRDGTGLVSNVLPGTANEWWMRSLSSALILGLGIYADRAQARLRRAEEERRVVQAKLDDALAKALSDFLPICAHCKAIREDERWYPVEAYIARHAKTRFSHGLCPRCVPLYAPDDDEAVT